MASSESAFFREILAMASAGHMASVVHLVQRRRDWLCDRAPSANQGEPYGRRPLHQDARGEIMLAGWQANQRCAPHDHAEARGIVIVLAGSFTETRFRHHAGVLSRVGATRGQVGSALAVTNGLIHDLSCDEAGATLHVYLPAIDRMRVYDASARVTWVVDEAAGAWIPNDQRRVIATENWSTRSHAPLS